jgi:hypothetical protein
MAAWTEASMDNEAHGVPPHVEQTVAAIAELHAAHYRQAGALQKIVSAGTAAVARPRTLGLFTVAIVGWLVLNIALTAAGGPLSVSAAFGSCFDGCALSGGDDPDRSATTTGSRRGATS